jgi:hypothetical protein
MKSWSTLICLAVLASPVAGQSLGDAAKKERDRRDKLRAAGASARTLTEQDLATTEGRLANNPKEETASGENGEASKGAGRATTSAPLPRTVPAAVPSRNGEEYWRRRAAEARGRVAEAQRRNDDLDIMIRFGQPAAYDGNGGRVIYSIHQMKAMADAAAAQLASAQAALDGVLEEGRRSGALPGWLR